MAVTLPSRASAVVGRPDDSARAARTISRHPRGWLPDRLRGRRCRAPARL